MFRVSVIASNATMVVYGILFGGVNPLVYIFTMCMQIETFRVSAITPNATMVVYGILFRGMHPVVLISMMCM